jgi:hypothetical protein
LAAIIISVDLFSAMSSVNEKVEVDAEAEVEADDVCASCGKVAADEIKLKKCACNLVKYCSVACQKNHRQQHKKICKRRLAEIRDDTLLTQPENSHLGECPLCCLPLSLDITKSHMSDCCSKVICNGCSYSNSKREFEAGLEPRCPFCREPRAESIEESDKRIMERIKKNDPTALWQKGKGRYDDGDYDGAFEYMSKAAGLGDVSAHFTLSSMYNNGEGVKKDEKMFIYHSEKAAIGGHPIARHNLAATEARNGRVERAMKHFIIAASLGYDESLEVLKECFQTGHVSKGDLEAALRAHHAALSAVKSPQREEAEREKGKTWR